MQVNEGNIFEAMRLVLPEHRGVMKGWQRERSMRKQPTLSEDEMENIRYVLTDSIQRSASVRLTLFGAQSDTELEGILVYDGRLKIATDEGVQMVNMERLIGVKLV